MDNRRESMKKIAVLFLACVLLAACAPVSAPTQNIDVSVQQTLTAQAVVPATQTTPSQETGSIAGEIQYPAEATPAVRVVAFDETTFQPYSVDTPLGQSWYQIDNLPPGTYVVVAYSLGGAGFPLGLSGGYTGAMRGEADDHTLVIVNVEAGLVTSSIHTGDWIAPAGSFPPMPGSVPPTP